MNIFKAIRRRYIDFLDYRDESEETFLNKKGEVVAIVTMCSLLSYLFHSIFHKKSRDVYATDEDFMRLYNVKRTPTQNPNEVSDDCWTLKDALESNKADDIKVPYEYYLDENNELNYDLCVKEMSSFDLIKDDKRTEITINNSSVGSVYSEELNFHEVSYKDGLLNLKFSFKK